MVQEMWYLKIFPFWPGSLMGQNHFNYFKQAGPEDPRSLTWETSIEMQK